MVNLAHLTLADAARMIAARELSSLELVEATYARIAEFDARLGSHVTLMTESALAAARAADAEIASGRRRSPLHGVTVALKDIYDTEGVLTAGGSKTGLGRIPDRDAETARRLRAAGAVITGKLTTHEYAHGGPSFDLPWPAGPQPLERGALLRRLVIRIGGGGGGRTLPWRARHRHRRLDSRTGRPFRHDRPDAELRPGEPAGGHSQLLHLRPLRAIGLDRRRLRVAARCSGRVRPRGPALERRARAPPAGVHGRVAGRPAAPLLGGGPRRRARNGHGLRARRRGAPRARRGGRDRPHCAGSGLV